MRICEINGTYRLRGEAVDDGVVSISNPVDICEAFASEVDFRGGRFTHFVPEPCSHKIVLPRPETEHATAQKLNFIADQADAPWCLRPVFRGSTTREIFFEYSFESIALACLFSMTFKSPVCEPK